MFLTLGSILIVYTLILSVVFTVAIISGSDILAENFKEQKGYLLLGLLFLLLSCCSAKIC